MPEIILEQPDFETATARVRDAEAAHEAGHAGLAEPQRQEKKFLDWLAVDRVTPLMEAQFLAHMEWDGREDAPDLEVEKAVRMREEIEKSLDRLRNGDLALAEIQALRGDATLVIAYCLHGLEEVKQRRLKQATIAAELSNFEGGGAVEFTMPQMATEALQRFYKEYENVGNHTLWWCNSAEKHLRGEGQAPNPYDVNRDCLGSYKSAFKSKFKIVTNEEAA